MYGKKKMGGKKMTGLRYETNQMNGCALSPKKKKKVTSQRLDITTGRKK